MSKEEIKSEINKVLDHFSDKTLHEQLRFLKELDSKPGTISFAKASLEKILEEDKNLLTRLAQ